MPKGNNHKWTLEEDELLKKFIAKKLKPKEISKEAKFHDIPLSALRARINKMKAENRMEENKEFLKQRNRNIPRMDSGKGMNIFQFTFFIEH